MPRPTSTAHDRDRRTVIGATGTTGSPPEGPPMPRPPLDWNLLAVLVTVVVVVILLDEPYAAAAATYALCNVEPPRWDALSRRLTG